MTVPRKTAPECPIERCIAVLPGRWKAMILWRLLLRPHRYSVLATALPGISQRALSQALAELAADGTVVRRDDAWSPTPLGEALRPTLEAMFAWGTLQGNGVATPTLNLVHEAG